MRFTTERRLAVTLLAILALVGCDKPKPGSGTEDGTKSGTKSGTTAAGVAQVGPGAGPGARASADAFLKALTQGKATPAQFTPAFKNVVARTDADAQAWLPVFQGAKFVVGEEATFGNAIVLRGRMESPDKKDAFALRMVKDGDGYKTDWLHRTPNMGVGLPVPADPAQAAAHDALRNFLDLLMGGNFAFAQALMTNDAKKSISPLPPGTKPADGSEYDAGFLTQTIRSWTRDVAGYAFTKTELAPGKDAATVTVELEAEGKKTPATVKLKKDAATGWWLVESFSK